MAQVQKKKKQGKTTPGEKYMSQGRAMAGGRGIDDQGHPSLSVPRLWA